MNSIERCNNYVFIEENNFKWSIRYDKEVKKILCLSSVYKLGILYSVEIKDNIEFLFSLFAQYANNTLDINKYKITFPSQQDQTKQIIIKYDNITLSFNIQREQAAKVDLNIFNVDYYQTSAIQQLVKRIKALEADNARLKQIEETNAMLVDKFNMLSNFIDMVIDNNKAAELKKIIAKDS